MQLVNSWKVMKMLIDQKQHIGDENPLHNNLHCLISVLDHAGVYIYSKDVSGRYTFVNKMASDLFGCKPEDIVGQTDEKIFHSAETRRNDWKVLVNGERVEAEERNIIAATGETRMFWSVKMPMYDDSGTIIGLSGVSTDITEVVEMKQEYQRLASTDPLTGLINRRAFLGAVKNEVYRVARYRASLSLAVIDIDYFKNVNDMYGHNTGDEVLVQLSSLLKKQIRDSDVVARWGGEEFVVLAPEAGLQSIKNMAEKIRQSVQSEKFPGVGKITCSIGVAQLEQGESFESFFNRADEALYSAKDNGRNQVEVAVTNVQYRLAQEASTNKRLSGISSSLYLGRVAV
jgi:diguanylate cyclase (GGDEF)-like protein/PAS domain S-box-containing protein